MIELQTLPTFPVFKPLDIDDRRLLTSYLSQFEPYSDFNFTSLYCWRGDGLSEVSHLNGNLVIRMPDYLNSQHKIYSILGNRKIDKSLLELFAITQKIDLVPQIVIDSLEDTENFSIIQSPDNYDYVYDLRDLSGLMGQRYKKHRNKNNKFIQDHKNVNLDVIVSTLIRPEHVEIIKDIDQQWSIEFDRESGDIRSEKIALNNLLANAEKFNLFVVEVSINGVMKAFSINEMLSDGYAICHFEKALKSHHNYIATFLVNVVATKLLEHGCQLINWEQDLGLEGLRKSKLSYRPTKYLMKYTIKSSPKLTRS